MLHEHCHLAFVIYALHVNLGVHLVVEVLFVIVLHLVLLINLIKIRLRDYAYILLNMSDYSYEIDFLFLYSLSHKVQLIQINLMTCTQILISSNPLDHSVLSLISNTTVFIACAEMFRYLPA
jgi:hypothetical protein